MYISRQSQYPQRRWPAIAIKKSIFIVSIFQPSQKSKSYFQSLTRFPRNTPVHSFLYSAYSSPYASRSRFSLVFINTTIRMIQSTGIIGNTQYLCRIFLMIQLIQKREKRSNCTHHNIKHDTDDKRIRYTDFFRCKKTVDKTPPDISEYITNRRYASIRIGVVSSFLIIFSSLSLQIRT